MKFIKSFKNAFKGLGKGLVLQRNIRLQLIVAVVVIALSFILRMDAVRISIILLLCSVILALEMINSSLERYIDYATPERAKEIGLVKDILAGAVLLLSIVSIVIGFLLFTKPILHWLGK